MASTDGLKYSISCCAYTALYREHARRNMASLNITQEEIDNILANSLCFGINSLKGTCFFRNVTLNHSYNFLGVNFHIISTNTTANGQQRYRSAVRIFLTFVNVMQVFRIRIMEMVQLNHDAFCQSYNSRNNTAGGSKVSLTNIFTLN